MEIGKETKRRAFVVMDIVPAHQVASIEPLIYIKSGSIGINITRNQDTAVPFPYHN